MTEGIEGTFVFSTDAGRVMNEGCCVWGAGRIGTNRFAQPALLCCLGQLSVLFGCSMSVVLCCNMSVMLCSEVAELKEDARTSHAASAERNFLGGGFPLLDCLCLRKTPKQSKLLSLETHAVWQMAVWQSVASHLHFPRVSFHFTTLSNSSLLTKPAHSDVCLDEMASGSSAWTKASSSASLSPPTASIRSE